MTKGFTDYLSLGRSLSILRRNTKVVPASELVPLGQSFGRVLSEDVVSRYDIPPADSAHMDGFAVRSSDLMGASGDAPVSLRWVRGSPLGVFPRKRVAKGEAHAILTGGFLPTGADAVVQVESTRREGSKVVFTRAPKVGEFVYPAGRDVRRSEVVISAGRELRGPDVVLLGSLHLDKVRVYRRPRVAILPTGNELTDDVRETRPGRVVETHGFLLSRMIDGAGGVPVRFPIVKDDGPAIAASLRSALRVADIVLTLAGSSVGEADLTEGAIRSVGRPGMLVHGMKVTRGRVMGFGAVDGKAVIILPGPIQGAANAFAVMAYPLIRSYLGRGFEEPPSVPATMGNDWDADERFGDFTKVVYVRKDDNGGTLVVHASSGETEKMTFLSRNDGYLLVGGETTSLRKGDPVRMYLLPGLSS